MTPESKLKNEIRLWCGERDLICIRANVGKVKMADGRYFDTGLPVGYPDLTIIGKGFVVFCETKIHPRKPTQDQLSFLAEMDKRGHGTIVPYTLEEFVKYMEDNYEC